jgi:hypothetical protein
MTQRRPTKLPRWHEWSIYLTFGLLVVTGVAWLILDRWVRIEGEFGPEHHPAEHIMLIFHGFAAYALLIVAGALIPVHIKLGWSIRHNLKSGIAVGAALVILSFTALSLYYFSGEGLRGLTSIGHWLVGIAAVPVLAIHVIRGRAVTRPPARSPLRRGRQRRGD